MVPKQFSAGTYRFKLKELLDLICTIEGTEEQSALRDILTDLRHLSDHMGLDYHAAEEGSYEVYLEEKAEPDFRCFPMLSDELERMARTVSEVEWEEEK